MQHKLRRSKGSRLHCQARPLGGVACCGWGRRDWCRPWPKFSKMQIIKWQPIKYANELCGVARTHTHTHRERRDRRWEWVRGGQTAAQHAPQIGRGGTYDLPGGEWGKERDRVHSVYGVSYTKQLIRFVYLRSKFNFLCSEFVKYDDDDGQYYNNI